jgi:hypothetical protein
MSNLWEELVGSGVINDKVQEALEQKLEDVKAETRKLVEAEVRADLTARFEKDKGDLIAAMDQVVRESITRELTEFQTDRQELKTQKVRLAKAIKEARAEYKTKLAEHSNVMKTFIMNNLKSELAEFAGDRAAIAKQRVKLSKAILEARKSYEAKLQEHVTLLKTFMLKQLNEEVSEFYKDKKALNEQKIITARKLKEHRNAMNNAFKHKTKTLETFVLGQLKKELREFKEDKDALVEQRVKLAGEAKRELAEAKKQFVKRAANLVENTLKDHIQKEMNQFRDDIKFARENHFGRKIFEAFSTEFMTSYLAEGTRVKQVQNKLDEANHKLNDAAKKLNEMARVKENTERKIKLVEDKHRRNEILNDLLSPLKREKKDMMANLLESVKTEQLKAAYHKFLPHVLNEGGSSKANAGRATLNENRVFVKNQKINESKIVENTGNRKNRISESVATDNNNISADSQELNEFLALAGIKTF